MGSQTENIVTASTALETYASKQPHCRQGHAELVNAIAWRIEKKFAFNHLIGGDALLGGACLPDALHPEDWVHTVHFDTAGLEAYRQCLDGELIKKKIRARWYADRPDALPEGSVNLEIKQRRGNATGKKSAAMGNWLYPKPKICLILTDGTISSTIQHLPH